jgi:hypothetical protein
VKQFAIAIDQLANTLIGGYSDETLSARAWRLRNTSKGWGRAQQWIDRLLFFDPDHCFQSFISEFERKHLPEEYQK